MTCGAIPSPHSLIPGARNKQIRLRWGESQSAHVIAMPDQIMLEGARSCIPYLNSLVLAAAGEQLGIRRELATLRDRKKRSIR